MSVLSPGGNVGRNVDTKPGYHHNTALIAKQLTQQVCSVLVVLVDILLIILSSAL